MANAEIVGVVLQMEDLVLFNAKKRARETAALAVTQASEITNAGGDETNEGKKASEPPVKDVVLANYAWLRKFLITWKILEQLKIDWSRRKLAVERVDTHELYARFWY